MAKLSNGILEVEIYRLGAELKSIRMNGREFMWSGDPKYWAKTSPILFPIVGQLRNNRFSYNDSIYSMNKHGFAREMIFDENLVSSTSAEYCLVDSEFTEKCYPFKFKLLIRYWLQNRSLFCEYNVYNTSDNDLLFSIGGHPAFHCLNNYKLQFRNTNYLECYNLEDGFLSNKLNHINLNDSCLLISDELFKNDALVLKNVADKKIILIDTEGNLVLQFEGYRFPYIGLWGKPGADFVCIEPWAGVNDVANFESDFSVKEGIISLPGGKSWDAIWSVEIL